MRISLPSLSLTALLFISFGPSIALAGLYPTYPTQESTIEAGKDTVIKWKNDDNSPNMKELGVLRVDLFIGDDDHFVSTLAKDINPEDRAAKIRVEPYLGSDGSDYYIRFTPTYYSPVYTGRFTIVGLTGKIHDENDLSGAQAAGGNGGDSADSDTLSSESTDDATQDDKGAVTTTGSLLASSATYGSGTVSLSRSVTETTTSTRGISIAATPYSSPDNSTSARDDMQKNGGTARYHRSRDTSGISQAGLVYLIWPVLMGALMAI